MKWGPPWANTVPLRIVCVTTPEGKARLMPHLQPGNVAKATAAPVNAILAVDSNFHHHIPRLLPFRPEMRDALESGPALHDRIGTGSAWLRPSRLTCLPVPRSGRTWPRRRSKVSTSGWWWFRPGAQTT